MPTNVTYVSVLSYNPADHISSTQRLEWLQPLLASKVPLYLFMDAEYTRLFCADPVISNLNHPDVTIRSWSFEESVTWRVCVAHSEMAPLGLPASRNGGKDTEYFLALMHAKAELVAEVATDATTPFVAFIDAGIHKIFKNPEGSWDRLSNLRIRTGWNGILLPGCWAPAEASRDSLAAKINWTFCGGFFILPRQDAGAFWIWQTDGLVPFLREGRITWEVNTWVNCLSTPAPQEGMEFHWFKADHNDSMMAIPTEWLE